MATLSAQLLLDLAQFTANLQIATQQVQAFAQRTASIFQQAAQGANALTVATQHVTSVNQAQAQATNQLAQAYLALAQSTNQQTQAYVQVQNAALQYRRQQDALRESLRQQREEQQRATAVTEAWQGALSRLADVGLKSLAALTTSLAALATQAVTAFAALESSVAKVGTQLQGFSAQNLAQMMDQVRTLATQFGQSTDSLTKALFDLLSANVSVKDSFSILRDSAQLAVAGFADVGTTTKATISVLQAYHLDATRSAAVTQALFKAQQQARVDMEALGQGIGKVLPIAATLKVDFRDLGALLGTLTHQGIAFNRATTEVERALISLAAPTEKAQKWMAAFSAETGRAPIELKRFADGSLDVLRTMEQFKGVPLDVLMRIVPRVEGARAILAFADNLGTLKGQLDAARASSDSMAEAYRNVERTVRQAFQEIREAANAFLTTLGEMIARTPGFASAMDSVKSFFISLRQAIADTTSPLRQGIELMGQFLALTGQMAKGTGQVLSGEAAMAARANQLQQEIKILEGQRGQSQGFLANIFARIGQEAAGQPKTGVVGPDELEKQIQLKTKELAELGNQMSKVAVTAKELKGLQVDAATAEEKAARAQLEAQKATNAAILPGAGTPGVTTAKALQDRIAADKEAAAEAKRAAREAEREAERLAEERLRITKQMLADIAGFEEGDAGRKKVRLAEELEDAKKAGVDKVLIEKYAAQQIAEIETEAFNKVLDQNAKIVADYRRAFAVRMEIEDKIDKRVAQSLGKQSENLRETLRQESNWLEEHGASVEQLAEHDAASAKIVENRQAEEFQKSLREQNRLAKEAMQPWTELAQELKSTLASTFEGLLDGTLNIFDAIKRGFIRLLANLAAAALTPIIINTVIGATGGMGGMMGAGSTYGSMEGGTAEGGMGLVGQASSVVGMGRQFGGNAVINQWMNRPIVSAWGGGAAAIPASDISGAGSYAAADAMGSTGYTAGGLSGVTYGQALGGIGMGVGSGMMISQLNAMMGLHGTANTMLSATAGGAIGGTMIMPGIGTAIGAAVGAIAGAIITLLGKKSIEPLMDIQKVTGGRVGYDTTQGLNLQTGFNVGGKAPFRDVGRFDYGTFLGTLNSSVDDLFGQVVKGFQGASPDIQKQLVDPLNQIADQVKQDIEATTFTGEHWKEDLQKFFEETLPANITALVKPLQEAVAKVDPVMKAWGDLISTLEQDIKALTDQQTQFDDAMATQMTALQEGMFSPAEQWGATNQRHADLQQRFAGASPRDQIAMAGQLVTATQQLWQMASSQFRPDTQTATGIRQGLFSPQEQRQALEQQLVAAVTQFQGGDAFTKGELAGQIAQLAAQTFALIKAQSEAADAAAQAAQQQLAAAHSQVDAADHNTVTAAQNVQAAADQVQAAADQAQAAHAQVQTVLAQVQQARAARTDANRDTLRGLGQALYSPAEQYVANQAEIQGLMQRFRGGDTATQARLGPELIQMVQQTLQLSRGQDVLGADVPLIREMQRQFIAIVDEVQQALAIGQEPQLNAQILAAQQAAAAADKQVLEAQHQVALAQEQLVVAQQASATARQQLVIAEQAAINAANVATLAHADLIAMQAQLAATVDATQAMTVQALANVRDALIGVLQQTQTLTDQAFGTLRDALQGQVNLAQQQVDLLGKSLGNLSSVDSTLQQSLAALNAIRAALAGQSFQHGSFAVPRTMHAVLHQGERVLTAQQAAGGGDTTITINVNGGSGHDSAMLADRVISELEKRGRLQSTRIQIARR